MKSLEEKRSLRRGLDADRAADILWTVNHPDVYRLLVNERGWSAERFEEWLGETLRSQLLA